MLFALLFFLLAAHALLDYSLQNDQMAICKCRGAKTPLQASVPWYYWLTAHAFLHGGAVGIVFRWIGGVGWNTPAPLAPAATGIHRLIDPGQGEKLYSIHLDHAIPP